MATCQPTDEAKRLLRAMAKAQLEMGVTDAHAIIDAIHARIADFAPMDKGEIADVISGFGQKAELGRLNKPELQQRMGQLKKDLREAYHGSPKDATRQAAIKKEIAKIEEQLRTGNFSKAKRAKPEYDARTQALQADLERARAKADMEMRKLQYQSKSPLYRATTLALNIGRAFILSSPTVFAHLAGASFWRLMGTLVEDTAGAAWRLVPKFSEIDKLAMVEGGGFQAGAHAAGLKAAFSKQTLKDIKDKLLKGQSDRQALYGKKGEYWTPHPMLEVMGHIHDSIKTPIENYAFERAITRVATNTRARMAREGMSADAIDKAFTTNTLQTQMAAMAYAESQAAKLQGANKLVDWLNETFGRMDRSGPAGQAGSAILRSQMPIVRIPTNLMKEGIELVGGVPMGLVKGFMADVSKMAPADADKIMRLLKKGTIGPALLAIGWYGYENMGGLYREGHKAPNKKEGYGDIGGISHHWLHAPIGDVAQMGALAHYVYDEDQAYGRKHHDPHSDIESRLQAVVQASGAFAFNIPLIEGPKALVEATHGGKGLQHWEGAMARQYLEPGALQFAARQGDTDAAGQTVKRYPRNMAQELEMGIPGHGFGPIKGRKDVPNKPPRLR